MNMLLLHSCHVRITAIISFLLGKNFLSLIITSCSLVHFERCSINSEEDKNSSLIHLIITVTLILHECSLIPNVSLPIMFAHNKAIQNDNELVVTSDLIALIM